MGIDTGKPLNILFFGTPEFAVVCLELLVKRNYKIVGVVTSPDRPAGRGKRLKSSAIKQFALEKQLPLFQPNNLKDQGFINSIKALHVDLAVVVAFRMLPQVVWSIPKRGTFNLHASLLPQYRGAAPINWALVNGEQETGVTTFFIDKAIDTGAILLQKKVAIEKGETAGHLHDRLAELGSGLICDTIDGLSANEIIAQPQNTPQTIKKASKLTKENTRLDWNQSSDALIHFVNGMNPYPGAWTVLKQKGEEIPIKIFTITFHKEKHRYTIGKLVTSEKQIRIAHHEGWVVCENLQLPNKRRMTAADLLNGYEFEADAAVF